MNFRHPYLADTQFACFAHRGGGKEHPENSRKAFEAVRDIGYRFIEIDVQASSDGVLVVFHDDHLDDLTDGTGTLSKLPIDTIQQAKISGTEPIMTLEEALVDFPGLRFNIDIKTDHALAPTIDLMEKMNCLDRVCLASFSDQRLSAVRQHFGDRACTGAGPADVRALKYGSWLMPSPAVEALCAQIPVWHGPIRLPTRRFNRFCNARGIAVHVWTIDEEARMRRLIRAGVNGLITDRPTLLRKVAMEEGVWEGN
ncbi:glycerophosphodiester phosphodiesterase [Stappia sp. F7233]|uniref:Glycerophosphodiester phosphodiesterase n=1 Tax=Stappia albiluteola TaxID=2758565 RepID=A0A839AB81_9HYPH|nr:glycerophosphodiester phosphodiesterase family protein [Stappia albiluteola]MBA5776920.1 glycerophosphodiester phosphodiesterase [Stappia albiluteola]